MHIKLIKSEVLYTEVPITHLLTKCTVKNTYDVFDDGDYVKTGVQFWDTFCFTDDFGNQYGISDKGQLFDYLLNDRE